MIFFPKKCLGGKSNATQFQCLESQKVIIQQQDEFILKQFHSQRCSVIVPAHRQHTNRFFPVEIPFVECSSGSLKLSKDVNSNSLQMENLFQIMLMLHHGGKFVVFVMFSHSKYYKSCIILFGQSWSAHQKERERAFLPRSMQWALLKQINLLASGLEGTSISGVIW